MPRTFAKISLLLLACCLALPVLGAESKDKKGDQKKGSAVASTQNIKASTSRDEMLDDMEMLDGVTIQEMDEKGSCRWILEGSSAKQVEGYKVRIFDVVVTMYRKDGSEVKLLTDSADVNRETGEIETDKQVQILDGERTITGRGMYIIYTKEKKECKLFHNVEIRTKLEKSKMDIFKAGGK